jgi:hypothetical protein
MQTGSQLNLIESRLFRLQQQVKQVALTALGSGQSPGAGAPEDPTVATRFRRLGQEFGPILQELDRIGRQLDQITNLLDHKDRIALRVGREYRYSARQSVRDLQARGQTVYQLLDDIRAEIEKIVADAGFPTERERIELINTAMEKVSEFAGHMHEAQALLSQPSGPHIAAPQLTVNVSLPGLLLTAYVLALYIVRKASAGGAETRF